MKPIFSSRDLLQKKKLPMRIIGRFLDVIQTYIRKCKRFFYRYKKHPTTNAPLVTQQSHKDINQNTKRTSPFHRLMRRKNTSHKKNSHHTWKRIFAFIGKSFLIIFLLGVTALIGIFIYFAKDLPEPGKVNTRFIAESTKIYDRTGEVLLYDIHGEEKRTIIPFDQIPQNIKDATIALEDHDFYSHHGVRPKAIIRALLSQVFHIGTPSGGSTITQQLVKNSILSNERSVTRKIKEAILAVEIELKFSKDEILGMYLNEIPYGSNAYGIEAAAQTFFNKHAKDLSVDEAATLAALPQAPSRYSPYGSHKDLLKGRQEYAIDQMADLGFISPDKKDDYKNIDVFSKLGRSRENIKAPHFVSYVRDQLEELYGDDFLRKNGLTVITTLDWHKQELAQQIVKEHALKNEQVYNAQNAALVAIDPATGDILTMVGSRDYFDEDIDGNVNVTIRERQPGSSFKPYVYLLSFVKGYTPETLLYDVETKFPILDQGKDYIPQNYDGTFRGPLKVKEALGQSLNIPAVKMLYLVGINDTVRFAKELGITTLRDPKDYGLALVLGGGEVRLLDHTAAFGVFANNGVKHQHHAIKEIRDKNDRIIKEDRNDDGDKIIEEKYITMLSHILSTNKYRAPAFGVQNPLRFDNRPVAAKTGTTNENRDAWTLGYTPDVAIGVWAGNNDNTRMNARGVGANAAAPIFRDFLLSAYPDPSGKSFGEYKKEETHKDILDGVLDKEEKADVCLISKKKNLYCLRNEFCPKDREKTRTIIKTHSILHYIQKDDPRGDEPEHPEEDPYYKPWERAIEKFYTKQDTKTIFAPDIDPCTRDDFDDYKPEIKIKSLKISGDTLQISIDTDTPFEKDYILYNIDGETIARTKEKSITYTIPLEKKGSTLSIEVVLYDRVGNVAKAQKEVRVPL